MVSAPSLLQRRRWQARNLAAMLVGGRLAAGLQVDALGCLAERAQDASLTRPLLVQVPPASPSPPPSLHVRYAPHLRNYERGCLPRHGGSTRRLLRGRHLQMEAAPLQHGMPELSHGHGSRLLFAHCMRHVHTI